MNKILLSIIGFISFYSESDDKFDVSKIYSFADEVKIKSGHVFYCDTSSNQIGYKIDLWDEKLTNFYYIDESDYGYSYGVRSVIRDFPMTDIDNKKNYARFKTPPEGNEGPKDDMNVWRRWYIDKINLRYSYRFFWNGKFLDPIEGDCSTQPPDFIKNLLNK